MKERTAIYGGLKFRVWGTLNLLPESELVFLDKRFKKNLRITRFKDLTKEQAKSLLGLGKSRIKESFLGVI